MSDEKPPLLPVIGVPDVSGLTVRANPLALSQYVIGVDYATGPNIVVGQLWGHRRAAVAACAADAPSQRQRRGAASVASDEPRAARSAPTRPARRMGRRGSSVERTGRGPLIAATKAQIWAAVREAAYQRAFAEGQPVAQENFRLGVEWAADGLVALAEGRGDDARESFAKSARLTKSAVDIMAAVRAIRDVPLQPRELPRQAADSPRGRDR